MRPSPASARSDEGFALVELLMTIAILGIAFVAIIAALGTAVRSSEVHRTSADANAALVSAAETVKAAPFTPCASAPGTYRTFLRANTPLPGGWAPDDLDVGTVTCPSASVQMVSVSVIAPGTTVTRTLTVAKAERPSTLPIPTTTTTTTPGPPPASSCKVIDARAFRFGSTVLVVVIANPAQPGCTMPIKARMSESTGGSSLIRLGWVWLGLISPGSQCNDGTCHVAVLDGANQIITTPKVVQ